MSLPSFFNRIIIFGDSLQPQPHNYRAGVHWCCFFISIIDESWALDSQKWDLIESFNSYFVLDKDGKTDLAYLFNKGLTPSFVS